MVTTLASGIDGMAYSFCESAAEMYAKVLYSLNSLGDRMMDILVPGSSGDTGTISGAISTVTNAVTGWTAKCAVPLMSACGMGITVLFFLMGLVELAASERMTVDTFMKFFSKFIVGIMLCAFSTQIFTGVLDMGNVLSKQVGQWSFDDIWSYSYTEGKDGEASTIEDQATESATVMDTIRGAGSSASTDTDSETPEVATDDYSVAMNTEIDLSDSLASEASLKSSLTTAFCNYTEEQEGLGHSAFGTSLGLMTSTWMTLGIINILCMALSVVTYFIAFSRIIELCVRGAFLPIGLSLMSDDGWHGAGGRYLKKFIAIVCQGAVLVAIAQITGKIMEAFMTNIMTNFTLGNATSSILMMVCIGIACVSVMFKSIGITNDIFGA